MNTKSSEKPQPDRKNGHKPEAAVLPEQTSEIAGVTELSSGLVGANGNGNVESQAARLNDARLQTIQRQRMAKQIGQMQGNQHLQRVIQTATRNGSSHKTNGNGHPSETVAESEYGDLDGLGVGGPLAFAGAAAGADLPPHGNGKSGVGQVSIQRSEEGEATEDKPTEEERVRALAAAKAADQVANQAQSTAKTETEKSKNAGAIEAEAGKTAKAQAQQASTEAKSLKQKGEEEAATASGNVAGVERVGEKPGAALSANGKSGKGGAAGAEMQPGGEPKAPEEKAPTSPAEDPAFQAVVGRVEGTAAREQTHAPASSKATEAQAAAVPPANETMSKAQANQVGEMEQVETPGFDAKAFKAQLMERIAATAPKSTSEADEFKEGNKMGAVKGEMQGKVEQEKTTSQAPLEEKTKAPPDPSGIEPKAVTPLPPAEAGAAPGNIGAEGAAPKPKTSSEVEKPFQESSQSIDKEMKDADVTDDQLANSNEPEFQGALASKKEAQTQAAQAPQQFRGFEGEQVNQAKTEAAGAAQAQLQTMHGDRATLLTQVVGQQTGAKTQDEVARAKVAGDIQQIYDKTKTKVETILKQLDTDVDTAFDAGAEAATKAFEDYVDAKMEAYKEERYGGMFGWAKWAKDKLFGMPGEVNAFYSAGRDLFIQKMDAVIDNVVKIIGRGMAESKAEVANGKKEIQTYVAQLPSDLKQVGEQAANDIQSKFDELEASIDAKSNELVDRLATKYNEKLQAVDARIDELKAANQGLVDKAINAVVGVIKAILKLKDMLLNLLAKIADVVMTIIKDPIGFLGNLIGAITLGLQNFITNLPKHLIDGLLSWLTGALGPMGIKLPEDIFSLEGIFSLVAQILGLTWDNIRARAVKILGEPVVKALETGFEIFKILITEGPAGLWKYVKEMFGNLKEMVMDAIMDMIQTQVVQAGIKWIMGLLTPAGAFIKAAMAIYDIVKFFFEKASQIGELINAIVDGIAAIAMGGISGAAKLIEDALARTLPIVIGFLANLLGLGDLAKKVQGIIEKIREKVDKGIDWVLMKAKAVAGKVMGKGAVAKGKEEKTSVDSEGKNVKAKVRNELSERLNGQIDSANDLQPIINNVYNKYQPEGLKSLDVVPVANFPGKFDILAEASAPEKTASVEAELGIETADLKLGLPKTALSAYLISSGNKTHNIGRLQSDEDGHAEEHLIDALEDDWTEAASKEGNNQIVVDITRSPCPNCANLLSKFVKEKQTKGYKVEMNINMVSIYGGRQEWVGSRIALKDLQKAGIKLNVWDVISYLEQIGGIDPKEITQQQQEKLRDRIQHVIVVLDEIQGIKAGK